MFISTYFLELEAQIANSKVVSHYQIRKRHIRISGGFIRLKANLLNGDLLEVFEHLYELDSQLQLSKYSYHWQDKNGRLLKRWDNAPHFPNLPYAPHHLHTADGNVQGIAVTPTLASVLAEIEHYLTTRP